MGLVDLTCVSGDGAGHAQEDHTSEKLEGGATHAYKSFEFQVNAVIVLTSDSGVFSFEGYPMSIWDSPGIF